jgi:hypothetical protein
MDNWMGMEKWWDETGTGIKICSQYNHFVYQKSCTVWARIEPGLWKVQTGD